MAAAPRREVALSPQWRGTAGSNDAVCGKSSRSEGDCSSANRSLSLVTAWPRCTWWRSSPSVRSAATQLPSSAKSRGLLTIACCCRRCWRRKCRARTSNCGRRAGGATAVSRCSMANGHRHRSDHPPRAARRRRNVALRQVGARHWLATDPARCPGHGIARRDHLPRSWRRCHHRSGSTTERPGGGDWRRFAWNRSCLWPGEGRGSQVRSST